MNILLLGGTGEARRLADGLSRRHGLRATLSLAGATRTPPVMPIATRTGGFGGAAGLADYLAAHAIDRVIDATHPFAVGMSHNAVAACRATGRPLWRLVRPVWRPGHDEPWHVVADGAAAAAALVDYGPRVFLTVGARSLAPFANVADKHWITRSIERPIRPPGFVTWTPIIARPPFSVAQEIALLRTHRVDVLVAKNGGAPSMRPKLEAARRLGVAVVMIARPALPAADRVFADIGCLLAALDHQAKSAG